MTELREEGLRVMRDDEPLAIAHREIRAAREGCPTRYPPAAGAPASPNPSNASTTIRCIR